MARWDIAAAQHNMCNIWYLVIVTRNLVTRRNPPNRAVRNLVSLRPVVSWGIAVRSANGNTPRANTAQTAHRPWEITPVWLQWVLFQTKVACSLIVERSHAICWWSVTRAICLSPLHNENELVNFVSVSYKSNAFTSWSSHCLWNLQTFEWMVMAWGYWIAEHFAKIWYYMKKIVCNTRWRKVKKGTSRKRNLLFSDGAFPTTFAPKLKHTRTYSNLKKQYFGTTLPSGVSH